MLANWCSTRMHKNVAHRYHTLGTSNSWVLEGEQDHCFLHSLAPKPVSYTGLCQATAATDFSFGATVKPTKDRTSSKEKVISQPKKQQTKALCVYVPGMILSCLRAWKARHSKCNMIFRGTIGRVEMHGHRAFMLARLIPVFPFSHQGLTWRLEVKLKALRMDFFFSRRSNTDQNRLKFVRFRLRFAYLTLN